MTVLDLDGLHDSLADPLLASMNFLNEVAERHPGAVSFAAGRPDETHFDVEAVHDHLRRFCRHLSEDLGRTPEQVRRTVCQYGRTKGVVHELVARSLLVDEQMTVDPESIVVTVGCQEAMVLVLRALRRDERDVLLAVTPTYVGLTGAARLVDMTVLPVPSGPEGVIPEDLAARAREARARGLRPRACYVIPDFANPTGAQLGVGVRRGLLEVAEREDLLLIEDNPYGVFDTGRRRTPTLKALDTRQRVVYLGSFSKSVLPGARVGFVVADQRVLGDRGSCTLLADELAKIKSMLTLNTSAISQAVVGGALLAHEGDLRRANSTQTARYAMRLAHLDGALRRNFAGRRDVQWTVPAGGYFIVLTTEVQLDDIAVEVCAAKHGVLWTPMRWFYSGSGGECGLRLSVSAVDETAIDMGVRRLASFLT